DRHGGNVRNGGRRQLSKKIGEVGRADPAWTIRVVPRDERRIRRNGRRHKRRLVANDERRWNGCAPERFSEGRIATQLVYLYFVADDPLRPDVADAGWTPDLSCSGQ